MADPTKTTWFQWLQNLPAQFDALTWLDFTFMIVVLIGLVIGNRKGFVDFFGKLLLLILSVTITHQFAKTIASSFPFNSPIAVVLMNALCFFSIAGVSYFLIGIVFKVVGKVLQVKFADLFERVMGTILGCAYFILLFSFISNFLLIFPGDWLHKTYEEQAPVGKFLVNLSPEVHKHVIQMIPPELRGQKLKANASA